MMILSRRPIALVAALLAVACLGCGTMMPLPPELEGAEVVASTGHARSIVMGKVSAPSLKPYVMKDLKTGSGSRALSAGAVAFGSPIGFEWREVGGGLSFGLAKADAGETTLGSAECVWGLATIAGSFAIGNYGGAFRMPKGSTLVCDFLVPPESEPWRLLLWTGPPSNVINPEFPSGGVLARGDERYEAVSTNAVGSSGIRSAYMTGTVFRLDGRSVVAIDRWLPSRVLVQPSLSPDDRNLFVAVGAAIFVYDTQTQAEMH